MRFAAVLLLCFVQPTTLYAQRALPEVKEEIDSYKEKLEDLKARYQEAVVKARTDLDVKLSTLTKKYVDAGRVDEARKIEAERREIQLSNELEKRLDLEKSIVGRRYKFNERQWVYEFDTDGYIVLPADERQYKRFPWVTLSESEVLFMNELGKLGVIRFSPDRKTFNMRIFQPQKADGNNNATLMR